MLEKNAEIKRLKDIFIKAKTAPRDEAGYFDDLDFHVEVGSAIVAVGKMKIYELKDELYLFLTDQYAPFRQDAINSLGRSINLMLPTFRDRAYEIWLNDPDENVKIEALSTWVGYFLESRNPEVLKILYNVIINRKSSVRIRKNAIFSLTWVAGKNFIDEHGNRDIMFSLDTDDPEEFGKWVDWSLVINIMKISIPDWKTT